MNDISSRVHGVQKAFLEKPLFLWMMGALFLVLLVGYIMQINASSTKAFALRDAEHRQEELRRANDRLQSEIDRLRSLSSVLERQAFLDLVPVESVSYIVLREGDTLALNE